MKIDVNIKDGADYYMVTFRRGTKNGFISFGYTIDHIIDLDRAYKQATRDVVFEDCYWIIIKV